MIWSSCNMLNKHNKFMFLQKWSKSTVFAVNLILISSLSDHHNHWCWSSDSDDELQCKHPHYLPFVPPFKAPVTISPHHHHAHHHQKHKRMEPSLTGFFYWLIFKTIYQPKGRLFKPELCVNVLKILWYVIELYLVALLLENFYCGKCFMFWE